MASNLEGSIYSGSDLIHDFSCDSCEENENNKLADFYCEKCLKFYCNTCLQHHNQLYKKHDIFGRNYLNKWPVAKASEDLHEYCLEHKDKKLEVFCEDHGDLLCAVCHIYRHKKCNRVELIADKLKDLIEKDAFKHLVSIIDILHGRLIQKTNGFEKHMDSLEKSYKTILNDINIIRKKVIDSLDKLHLKTIRELDDLKADLMKSLQTDITICNDNINAMKSVKITIQDMPKKSETVQFLTYIKCIDKSHQADKMLQEMAAKDEITISFKPDTIVEQTLSALSGLGSFQKNEVQPTKEDVVTSQVVHGEVSSLNQKNQLIDPEKRMCEENQEDLFANLIPGSSSQTFHDNQKYGLNKARTLSHLDQVITVSNKTLYNVSSKSDSQTCCITAICEMATGELLISDFNNKSVKLLSQTSTEVVAHYDFLETILSIFNIEPYLVAVTVGKNEIHFIRMVNNCQLLKDRKLKKLKLPHRCMSIAHNQGIIYVTSGTELYSYTIDGELVSKIYEDTSTRNSATACAVSPDGNNIYVVNGHSERLVTLSRDGTVIATMNDPALQWGTEMFGIHVTDSGQVLVCGGLSNRIIQVENRGIQKLAEVVSGVRKPIAVFYSKSRDSLIVSMKDNNNILVCKIQSNNICTPRKHSYENTHVNTL